jgi:hypothetical protein
MQMFRTMRFVLLALLVSVTAASSHAQFGISINVGFAPPALPIYVQPICPQPNLMWTPGYWAYSNDYGDYYWVPGTWVPAPYLGALWTPPTGDGITAGMDSTADIGAGMWVTTVA